MTGVGPVGPFAFGGGPLDGDRWVRVLYLDESGIGKLKHDPIVVVAGVVIHADTQWGALASRLDGLLSAAVPLGSKKPQFLHAKDIYHGSGEFPRDTWDMPRRNDLLKAVGDLIHEFQLPVVWSATDRKQFARENPDEPEAEHLREIYTVCAVSCFLQAEAYMRQSNPGEVCSIVMEQNHELQKRIPEMMASLRNPEEIEGLIDGWEQAIPLTKLIDTPACQPKTASSILQLADYCAFAVKRRLQGSGGSRRLTSPIAETMLRYEDPGERGEGKRSFWNPIHMPSMWPRPMKLEDGAFKWADE